MMENVNKNLAIQSDEKGVPDGNADARMLPKEPGIEAQDNRFADCRVCGRSESVPYLHHHTFANSHKFEPATDWQMAARR